MMRRFTDLRESQEIAIPDLSRPVTDSKMSTDDSSCAIISRYFETAQPEVVKYLSDIPPYLREPILEEVCIEVLRDVYDVLNITSREDDIDFSHEFLRQSFNLISHGIIQRYVELRAKEKISHIDPHLEFLADGKTEIDPAFRVIHEFYDQALEGLLDEYCEEFAEICSRLAKHSEEVQNYIVERALGYAKSDIKEIMRVSKKFKPELMPLNNFVNRFVMLMPGIARTSLLIRIKLELSVYERRNGVNSTAQFQIVEGDLVEDSGFVDNIRDVRLGDGSHVEGEGSHVEGDGSHVEGEGRLEGQIDSQSFVAENSENSEILVRAILNAWENCKELSMFLVDMGEDIGDEDFEELKEFLEDGCDEFNATVDKKYQFQLLCFKGGKILIVFSDNPIRRTGVLAYKLLNKLKLRFKGRFGGVVPKVALSRLVPEIYDEEFCGAEQDIRDFVITKAQYDVWEHLTEGLKACNGANGNTSIAFGKDVFLQDEFFRTPESELVISGDIIMQTRENRVLGRVEKGGNGARGNGKGVGAGENSAITKEYDSPVDGFGDVASSSVTVDAPSYVPDPLELFPRRYSDFFGDPEELAKADDTRVIRRG